MLNSNINKALEINSNKAVLLSIKKQWLEKILSGEKTIEVRKTMPWEISYPFVVYTLSQRIPRRLSRKRL